MNNNNHLVQSETIPCSLSNFSSDTSLGQSPRQLNFKDKEYFLKSQISLADTTCDQSSPLFHKFQDIITDEQSFSLTEFNLEESSCSIEEDGFCNDFIEHGFCMKGVECGKNHNKIKENTNYTNEKSMALKFIMQEIPQILVTCRRRTTCFLP